MIKNLLNHNYIGAEIGVLNGTFSEELLKLNPSILHLVDLWTGIVESGDENGNNLKKWNSENCHFNVLNKFKNNNNVKIIKENSIRFLNSCPDNYYDFIYIDTIHDFEYTLKELNSAWPKIKKGGYLAGHDFDTTEKCLNNLIFGVDKAVYKFCLDHNTKITSLAFDGCISFSIKK